MYFYVIFFITIFISLHLKDTLLVDKLKITGLQISFLVIFVFCALRFDVGYDYPMYYKTASDITPFSEAQLARLELLSGYLIKISRHLNFNQFFFISTSLIISYLFYKSINDNSYDKSISTMIFLCVPIFFFNSLSIIRQFVAIAIVFYSFKYIKERKIIHFISLIGIGSLFHTSIYIAIPLYFLYNDIFHKKTIILVLYILSFFSSKLISLIIKLFSEHYSRYLGIIKGEGGDMVLIFFQIIGLLLIPIIYQNKLKDKDFKFFTLTFYIGLFIWSSLAKFGHAGFRGGLYFVVFIILLVPCLKNIIKEYNILKQLTFLTCTLMFFGNLYVGSKHKIKDPNLPYQTFFFKTKKDLK